MLEITDENVKTTIKFLLKNLWCANQEHLFPHQICEYIERKDLFKLKSFLYYYYKKNTKKEKKALLFLFTDSSLEQRAVLIMRDFSIYSIDIDCKPEYYKNSIFDVSLLDDKIIIYDTIYISGIKINNYKFIERIYEAEIFKTNTNYSHINICEYLQEIFELNDTLIPYEEEIFIISNNFPILSGINRGCFKWRPSEHTYISLKVEENGDDLLLYASDNKRDVIFSKIHSSNSCGKKYINYIKQLSDYKNGCVIDVCFNENSIENENENENEKNSENENKIDNKIKFLRVSNNYKASIRCIEKLLYIKNENITIHDMAQ